MTEPIPEYKVSPIQILHKLYQIHGTAMAKFPMVCKEQCADCCTGNVVATSIEISYLLSKLNSQEIAHLNTRIKDGFPGKRYQPGMTTNGFAIQCMEENGPEPEEEENDPSWGKCPLLENGRCSVYEARPFGCRSMISELVCHDQGIAQVPPLALTLNTIFLQYIEHIDSKGFSGNLSDMVLLYLNQLDVCSNGGAGALYLSLENIENSDKTGGVIQNYKIPALMVPPEHRRDVESILKEISALG